jgi:starvation-inducible outer membrane lipoprotein
VKPALLSAALIALAGCASTPPPVQAEQKSSAEAGADDCGKQPVRTLNSSMSPRLVVYRACKARGAP